MMSGLTLFVTDIVAAGLVGDCGISLGFRLQTRWLVFCLNRALFV